MRSWDNGGDYLHTTSRPWPDYKDQINLSSKTEYLSSGGISHCFSTTSMHISYVLDRKSDIIPSDDMRFGDSISTKLGVKLKKNVFAQKKKFEKCLYK